MTQATTEKHYDCIVIGSGPGGYVAAIRASQLGLSTAVVEKESPGGVCLNWGCIPTKALLKSAEVYHTLRHASDFGLSVQSVGYHFPAVIDRSRKVVDKMTKGVEFLLKKNKIDLIKGHGALQKDGKILVLTPEGNEKYFGYENVIIATGGRARTLPHLNVDGERIITYRQALALKDRPNKLLVIGAGAIGIEFAYFYNSFGAEVTVVEMADQILPIEDSDVSAALAKSLGRSGMKIKTSSSVQSVTRNGDTVSAVIKSGNETETWTGDFCLVAIGVQGNIENLGLDQAGVVTDRSFIPVDEYYQTEVPGIYAIGDIIGPPLLAHVASHEGIIAAEHMAGANPHPIDYLSIPGCTFCQPQVASIGLTEKAALEAGYSIRTGKFPFSASGKAVATNETDGFTKVIIDETTEEVLGVHIIHPEATELIGEASIIKSHEGIASSVLNTIHAHPTLSETIMEAMGDALGRAVHI
ncbi:MAG TPA: dihydrolipoyl dehydrogenase [Oligoflexia bacterium]|nr:dihydrolipoyl dehydrogenase [Oligoflexia bacterium]HMP48208.1 dihydrolipoyl dehydrogenase [Oligoflexia bacterium]